MIVDKLDCCKLGRVRKGGELKAPRYASAAASCDDYVTICDIIPNTQIFLKINLR